MVDLRFEIAADDRSALQTGIGNRFCELSLQGKVFWDWFFDLIKQLPIATAIIHIPMTPMVAELGIPLLAFHNSRILEGYWPH